MMRKTHTVHNIGFVTLWFERGQAYVTKTLRDILSKKYKTFILARTSNKFYGKVYLETKGFWDVPNLTTFKDYEIPSYVMMKWIEENNLEVVIFNEEFDWGLVDLCKRKGLKTISYLDFYSEDWREYLSLYDAILCSTRRTFDLVKEFSNAYYIGWGIDLRLFYPRDDNDAKYTFFHNAGWLGINFRKMTPAVIIAFDTISKICQDFTLLVHSQARIEYLPPEVIKITKTNPHIHYFHGTLPAPGLYHKGLIYCYPSKLDGLGLSFLEALACGLPVIATDAPPMNEFIKDGYNGVLVKVAKRMNRWDGIAFPEEICDLNDLSLKMYFLARNKELVLEMARNARKYGEENLNWTKKEEILFQIIEGLR